MSLNAAIARARAEILLLEDELAAAYEKPLRAAARKAASRFRVRAVTLTAASQPWQPPDPESLVDTDKTVAAAQKAAAPIHARALKAVADADIAISFTVQNPAAEALLGQASARAAQIIGGFPDEIASAIADAHNQGLSVVNAAKLLEQRGVDASEVTARMLARTTLNGIANGGSLALAQLVNDASVEAGEVGVASKTWVTAGDERVRDTHAEADGQTVPIDQPFDVGGEQLMYPGDPNGSLEETINCRCVPVYGNDEVTAAGVAPTDGLHSPVTVAASPEDTVLEDYERNLISKDALREAAGMTEPPAGVLRDFHLTAAVGEATRWTATLLVEGEPTEDGRMIATDATTWRGLPLPLGLMTETNHSDGGEAPVVGRIDQIWRAGNLIQAAGIFNDLAAGQAGVDAREAVQLVRDKMVTGISVDPAGCEVEIVVTAAEPDDAAEEASDATGDDYYEEPSEIDYDDDMEYLAVFTQLTIGGATICPIQAVAQAKIELVAAGEPGPFVSEFAVSLSEVAAEPTTIDAADTLRETALQAVAALAAAARPEITVPDPGPQLAELAERLSSFDARLAGLEPLVAAGNEAATAAAGRRTEDLQALRNEIFDRFAELERQQTASLTAAAAGAEAAEQFTQTLERIAAQVARSVELLERKPREVKFERDERGRLVGTRESS